MSRCLLLERLAEGLSQVIYCRHESLFTRFERKSTARGRPGQIPARDCEHVWRLPGDAQTLSEATTRDGKRPPQADSRAALQETRASGGRAGGSTESAHRCHLRRPLPTVGNDLWDAGEYEHDEPGHPPGGLDAQKKLWVPANATKRPVPAGASKHAN